MEGNNRKKGKGPKDFTIKFKVFQHLVNPSKQLCNLKLVKPHIEPDETNYERRVATGLQDYPNVSMIRENATNEHAFNIMFNLNHKNITSMKGMGPLSQGSNVVVFIEECVGLMEETLWPLVADGFEHIPSDVFQTILSEVIEGIEFLRRNKLYHGNLSWKSVLHKHPYTVKLFNFRANDSVTMEEAQWEDWMNFKQMLKDVSDKAARENQNPQIERQYFCGEIDSLIELLSNSDRNMLPILKRCVCEDIFFWKSKRRTRFITTTVSKLVLHDKFRAQIDKSDVCEVPWDSHCKNGPLDADTASIFSSVFDHCKKYRAGLVPEVKPFNPKKKSDCIRLACAAYTHQDEMKDFLHGGVDHIFRAKFPKLFIELKRIIIGVLPKEDQEAVEQGAKTLEEAALNFQPSEAAQDDRGAVLLD